MGNFVSIESLRAYMAWWVVLGHASHLVGGKSYLPGPVVGLIEHANIAVNVFIIVSGFVITHLLTLKKESYLPYIARRAFRLFPVYLFCLFIAMAVSTFYMSAYTLPWVFESGMRMDRAALEQSDFLQYFLLHLTMLHGIIPDSVLPYSSSAFLAPAWSLSLEWQFYLVAPLLIWLLTRGSWTMLCTVGVLLATMVVAKSGLIGEWHYSSFLPLAIHYFMIGILSRIVLGDPQMKTAGAETFIVLGAAIATLSGPMEAAIWIVFMAVAMMEQGMIATRVPLISRVVDVLILNPHVAKIGSWSYSTYLIHIPVFALLVGGAAMVDPDLSQNTVLAIVLLSFPLVLLISWGSYSLIEQPFSSMGRKIAKNLAARSATVSPA